MFSKEDLIRMEYILEPQKPGEFELKKFLRYNGYDVEDVSNNPDYWSLDIDLMVGDTGLEVKWDNVMSATGNLFIEICSNTDTNQPGWYEFCKADYLFYGDATNKIFYIFKMDELRAHIDSHKAEYKVGTAPDYGKDGIKKYSKGYLVPVDSLVGLYNMVDVSNF